MAARIDNGRAQLLTRTGLDWTNKYPSAIAALANLNVKTAYLDGELCGVDDAADCRASLIPKLRPTVSAVSTSSITLSIFCISTAGTFRTCRSSNAKSFLSYWLPTSPAISSMAMRRATANSY
jgi:hypothetical protein